MEKWAGKNFWQKAIVPVSLEKVKISMILPITITGFRITQGKP